MTTLRSLGYFTLFVVALAGWTRTGTRKEMLRLQVSSASGSKVSVRLRARGLYVMQAGGMFGRPATTDTTMSTPAEVTLFGVGDADLQAVEPTGKLVVSAARLSQNAPPAQRLTGRAFRVAHAALAEPYQVSVVNPR